MADTNSIDAHLKAYADLFIARFDSIAGDWRKPWLPTLPFASQNAAGHLYSGVNDVNLSLICALKGFEIPVWLTSSQCRDLGVMRLKGESGVTVYWGGTSFLDKTTGKVDTEMRWSDYQKMSQQEKNRYALREGSGNSAYVWNIAQTDFRERHPDTWENLAAAFRSERCEHTQDTLDAFLEKGSWYPDDCHRCPVVQTDEGVAQYNRSVGCIEIPKKELFSDSREFYNTLLHTLAHSAIVEYVAAGPKKDVDPLSDMARLNLASELAAAVIAGRLGMGATLTRSNLQYLKEWSRILSDDPSVIRDVTRESRYAVQLLTERLGISQSQAPDICATIGEQIRQAQENRQEKAVPKGRRVSSEENGRTGRPRIVRGGQRPHL